MQAYLVLNAASPSFASSGLSIKLLSLARISTVNWNAGKKVVVIGMLLFPVIPSFTPLINRDTFVLKQKNIRERRKKKSQRCDVRH